MWILCSLQIRKAGLGTDTAKSNKNIKIMNWCLVRSLSVQLCQSGYLCFLCQQKLSQSSDFSIQSRKYKIVDEEPLRRLCSDQYIFILFVYLLIMIGVWREAIYTRWLILVFLMTFFIYSSITAQGGIIYWTHTRLHSLGPLGCWLHNNLNKNLALTL